MENSNVDLHQSLIFPKGRSLPGVQGHPVSNFLHGIQKEDYNSTAMKCLTYASNRWLLIEEASEVAFCTFLMNLSSASGVGVKGSGMLFIIEPLLVYKILPSNSFL